MRRATFIAATLIIAAMVLIFVVVTRFAHVEEGVERSAAAPPSIIPSTPAAEPAAHAASGFLYGRITDIDGATYEGRLRWGSEGDQEAFWGDYFNGARAGNSWAAHAPRAQQPDERTIEIFGIRIGGDRPDDLQRPFMARFGDIARVEAHFRDVQVTLKSGTVWTLDRFAAGDIDDGVRVWDGRRGVVDLDARDIRTIEFLPTPPLFDAPVRLHGTVRTRQGDLTGFIQWNQQDGVGADELEGRTADDERSVRYDTIRAIARHARDSAAVTLLDGREIVLTGTPESGRGNRGIYVDGTRYGRMLISWEAFERVDFSHGGSGPAYGDFPPGRALSGSVSTRDGRRLTGRLVYDFDESETTDMLDVSSEGVDYNIPFGLIASIVPRGRQGDASRRATVILHDGAELELERTGDLGDRNAGLLIFGGEREGPDYVTWTDVAQVDLDHGPGTPSPPGGR